MHITQTPGLMMMMMMMIELIMGLYSQCVQLAETKFEEI